MICQWVGGEIDGGMRGENYRKFEGIKREKWGKGIKIELLSGNERRLIKILLIARKIFSLIREILFLRYVLLVLPLLFHQNKCYSL